MTRAIRAGVIGAGVFGGYHARQWASRPDIAFAGVFDIHADRAADLATRHGGLAFADEAALLAAVDVVSVCSPASAHGPTALAALRAGVAVYIEKPIAVDPETADRIVSEGRRRGLVVASGFLERATAKALGLFDIAIAPVRLEARRMGLASPRNLDVSVVLDLMIHDIDLALRLARAAPFAVEAEGEYDADGRLNAVTAEITFEDGSSAVLSASRQAASRQRTLRLVYPQGEISVDLLGGAVSNTTAFALNPAFAEAGHDPLAASLDAFIAAVRGERSAPLADGSDGVRALDLALAVERAVGG